MTVGYVVWDAERVDALPLVEPAPTLAASGAPHAMLMTLRHIVRLTGPRAYERLGSLPSRHWSFVELV